MPSRGNVLQFPVHAASTGKKSSAETSPSVTDLMRAASSQEGELSPRRMRLTVERSDRTSTATSLSSKPLRAIQSESFMATDSASSALCMSSTSASEAVDSKKPGPQSSRMAPIPKPRPKQKTFLRAWREYRGLSQEAAASRIGIDRTTLSKIERGKVPYDQALLERAADAYSCQPADILMRNPSSPIWTLLDVVRDLPEFQQKQIIGIIKGFLNSEAA
jgi:transcriptional regulator with XRE-family HTH domain